MSSNRTRGRLSRAPEAREETLAGVFLDAERSLGAGSRILAIEDRDGHVERGLAERGAEVTRWCRASAGTRAGTPWPPAGPYSACALRLPRSKPALELALHAAASELEPGAPIWIFGANDEGIRSLPARLEPLFEDPFTLVARRHARVFQARRAGAAAARAPLSAWQIPGSLELPHGVRPWLRYPGVFARGELDPGTARLLELLPKPEPGQRVLDFAAGAGVIAADLTLREPTLELHLLEADAIALEAARANLPGARLHLSDGWHAAPAFVFDWIVSNPPIHRGHQKDAALLETLVLEAPRFLRPTGALWFVVQRTLPVERLVGRAFETLELLGGDTRFRAWKASEPRRSGIRRVR